MNRCSSKALNAIAYVLPMLILALLFMFPPGLRASASNSGLHADIAALLKQEGLTGAVWAMLDPDGGFTVDAAGVKDARSGQLLSPDDRVHIGSVAKPLIATGVLRLVTEGKLSLDTPVLPVPFFLGQSFLQLGDLTPASALLAVVTAMLPLAMLVGLVLYFCRRPAGAVAVLDGLAMLAVLQWAIVLATWSLLPLQLWA